MTTLTDQIPHFGSNGIDKVPFKIQNTKRHKKTYLTSWSFKLKTYQKSQFLSQSSKQTFQKTIIRTRSQSLEDKLVISREKQQRNNR